MQQDRAQTYRKALCLVGWQVQGAIHSGREHPDDVSDRDILGRRCDTASGESSRHIGAHTRIDRRCGISRVRKQPHHCGCLFRRAAAKMKYAAKCARDSLRWVFDSLIYPRDLGFQADANLRCQLALERILVSEIIVEGTLADIRPHCDLIDAERVEAAL